MIQNNVAKRPSKKDMGDSLKQTNKKRNRTFFLTNIEQF